MIFKVIEGGRGQAVLADERPEAGRGPSPDDVRIFRVTPVVVYVLDYSKGFGHNDLIAC